MAWCQPFKDIDDNFERLVVDAKVTCVDDGFYSDKVVK